MKNEGVITTRIVERIVVESTTAATLEYPTAATPKHPASAKAEHVIGYRQCCKNSVQELMHVSKHKRKKI